MTNERRRGMDHQYVTRREWDMHLRQGEEYQRRISAHLTQQDTKIDALEATIFKLVGGVGVAVVAVQIMTTIILGTLLK